ncbi:Fungal specific transcription factor domain [Rhizoctonia solani]|uniref:Fungal specific transcription factor domain n=1 Tax=Rhizoctonia solani TaxID=456999 RepID=A0A8H8NV50_9AGAM|nr:Fungal specific transcription factor domain [Rhizoctonia solani]QRW20641.1 Fungal specific transcription factor domain [Rhizoctonia solani]
MIQLELENDAISPWIKLAGLWELLNYEYFDGILSSYYAHLNQAASVVRLALGSNTIDILKLSGEQTFDLRCIAWADILSSMALTRPTLLNYESDIHNRPQYDDSGDPDKGVEWRTETCLHFIRGKVECGHEIQQLVCDWKFRPVPAQRSALRVARVASQEIWRHAAILYIHQSILKSDSSNPVVRNSVKLIIQIASTLIPGVNPDCFLAVPYFISAEGLHQYPELIGLIYGELYFVVAPSFGFVLVRTQPDGREEILGCILGTPDTRKFEPAIDEQWFSQLRSDYPQNPYPFNSTQADRVMIDRIHQPETTPPEVLATTRAHIHIDLLPQAQRQGWGSKLMGKAVNYLKKQGCDSLFVGIEPRMHAAVHFTSRWIQASYFMGRLLSSRL